MSKFAFAFLILSISSLNIRCFCPNKSKIIDYNLNLHGLPRNKYALSMDGKSFCFINEKGWLVRIMLESGLRDSVIVVKNRDVCINVLSSKEGFSVLSFDKQSQYMEDAPKNVFLRNYDHNLIPKDSLVFTVPSPSRLLDEDFSFSTMFFVKTRNIVYFNNEFSNLLVVENNSWSFDFQNKTIVDPANGKVYEATLEKREGKNQICLSSNSERIYLPNVNMAPSQFSVFDNKVVYSNNGNLYWKDKEGLPDWNELVGNSFNPCDRFQNGLFRLNKGVLSLLFLE